jgi:hypothetical protein
VKRQFNDFVIVSAGNVEALSTEVLKASEYGVMPLGQPFVFDGRVHQALVGFVKQPKEKAE